MLSNAEHDGCVRSSDKTYDGHTDISTVPVPLTPTQITEEQMPTIT